MWNARRSTSNTGGQSPHSIDESVEDLRPEGEVARIRAMEEQREEFFVEPREEPLRRSPRLAQQATLPHTDSVRNETTSVSSGARPHVVEKWVKLGGAITQTWIVIDPITQCHRYYCATGESGPGRLADLLEQDMSQYAMHKCRVDGTALTKPVERAVRKKLVECSKGDAPMPSKDEWREYLSMESQTLCIEYSCRHCGALCKVFNKYGQ